MRIKSFSPGQIVATPSVLEVVSMERISECLQRHLLGDWGTCSAIDWHANDLATWDGSRIFSVYTINELDETSERFWIITEAEGEYEDGIYRKSTCVLTPGDY